jgi:hypothetical protein
MAPNTQKNNNVETLCVFFELRTGILDVIYMSFKGLNGIRLISVFNSDVCT